MKKVLRLLAALLVAVLLFSGCSLSAPVQESKNGEVAKRPNTIENFRLKVFLQEQNDEAKENLFALYHAIMQFEETCYLPYPQPQEQVQSQLSLLCYECPELFQGLTAATAHDLGPKCTGFLKCAGQHTTQTAAAGHDGFLE